MKYGVFIVPTEYTIAVDELAAAAEERGFESLFLPEHTHIPAARRTPPPAGGELPRQYLHILDPFAALTWAAAATKSIKLGTAICLVTEHDPIVLAKTVATLDLLSKGRLLFGIGAGWNVEELENHGAAFNTRWKLLRERVSAIKEIWTHDQAEYHGELVNFDRIWSFPKPAQKPHPPILLGAHTPASLKRVIDYCDGWIPAINLAADFFGLLRELRRRAEAAGRDPKSIPVTVMGPQRDRADLDRYEAAGVERVVFNLPSIGRDEVLPKLDKYAAFLR